MEDVKYVIAKNRTAANTAEPLKATHKNVKTINIWIIIKKKIYAHCHSNFEMNFGQENIVRIIKIITNIFLNKSKIRYWYFFYHDYILKYLIS